MSARLLSLSAALLAITACAPSSDEGEGGAPSVPPGFELAVAKEPLAHGAGAGTAAALVGMLDVAELREAIDSGKVMLIDVRTPEEFAEGHIAGAINIPLDQFDPLHLPGAGERETILYCRSDRRSGIAAARYVEAIGRPIRHLAGGILAWQDAGQPVD